MLDVKNLHAGYGKLPVLHDVNIHVETEEFVALIGPNGVGKITLFPRLQEREGQLAGTLSGGERKMLSIARGLMCDPKLVMIDEPSGGLAPNLVLEVFRSLKILSQAGVTILLVEQNVNSTLKIVDRAYVLEQVRIVLQGSAQALVEDNHVRNSYPGLSAA